MLAIGAIRSILRQSFTDFEFIICNDCSTDKTSEIIEGFAEQDSRIKILNNNNPGFSQALNLGLSECRGTYIARMDDDDVASPDRLLKENSILDMNSHISIVGTGISLFNENGVFGKILYKKWPDKSDIWRGKIFAHPTVMFKRKVYDSIGGYSESKNELRIEDYDYWCRCYTAGFTGINIEETLLNYREDSNSFKKRNNARRLRLVGCMIKWRKRMGIPIYFSIFELYEILKCVSPQKLIQKYHELIYKI